MNEGTRTPAVREGMREGNEFARSSFALVPADEGSPWAVEIFSSVSGTEEPKVSFSILYQGKTLTTIGHITSDILTGGWENSVGEAASDIVGELRKRDITVSPGFSGEFVECSNLARKHAIFTMVRSQASRLIDLIPARDACIMWMEADARRIMMA